jgi:hypothetical protein
MHLVAAGDPTNSYLMHKLDGDSCQWATDCAANQSVNQEFAGCGILMPFDSPELAADTRDTIRRWIKQGAMNN